MDKPIIANRYQIERYLKEEIEVRVYSAKDLCDNQKVMLRFSEKTISDKKYSTLKKVNIAKLKHENIIQIKDHGLHNGRYYIVTEFFEGSSLIDMISKRYLTTEQILKVAISVLEALEYAHKQKVIHKDISVDNILITSGNIVKLAGFFEYDVYNIINQGNQRNIYSNIQYLALESMKEGTRTPSSDVYALGISLYVLLSKGFSPFLASNLSQILTSKKQNDYIPLRERNPNINNKVVCIVEKAMAASIKDRYTVVEMMTDLKKYQEE
ncbi:serine/threonine-protein kinase [Candidatus Uabimicrobium amorphum]|uniref:Serine/threonine protein kinase n=1 Tax=Uabimicrobium amorphum TaxID=2596890 RepID=A0A5S9IND9_UABAM|nr:serine/threonine-protein kinase [Candidatus Uabimicrobium amorphum]BBM84521.1 serine/threonine protein kinase [Candidatus Uabimicrobium amorphum]